MKVKREKTYTMEVEVKPKLAEHGKFEIRAGWYQEETGKYPTTTHFNNQGTICTLVPKVYSLFVDGKFKSDFITKKAAIKAAKQELGYL